LVAEYAGLSLFEVRELDHLQYLIWRRDAFIHKMNQTEEGQKYLDNAWRLEQTAPDRLGLRRKLGRKEETPNG
jgi:predicted RNA polymerase sigma factor